MLNAVAEQSSVGILARRGSRSMKALITGGAGFIGGHLAERLVREGLEVHVIDDLSSGFERNLVEIGDRITFHRGSILDEALLARAADGAHAIFHLAAVASVPQSIAQPIFANAVNITGTLQILEAARINGSRVVFSSSSAVYGDGPEPVKTEDLTPRPLSPYAIHKLAGEHYLQSYHLLHGLEGFALRYFNVFGRRQNPDSEYAAVIPKFVQRARQGEDLRIFGDGGQTRDFIHVSDVVEANWRAMNAEGADGIALNIGTGQRTDLNTLAEAVIRACGASVGVRHEAERAGDIRHSCCDNSLAARRLGFQPRLSLAQGLQEMISAVPIS